MGPLKNIRQERFCREYVKIGIGSEAYRRAYPEANPYRTARFNASRLLTRANVKKRIATLRAKAMRRADITLEKILTDYQDAMDIAKGQQRASEIVQAATAQAKIVGLLIEKREIGAAGEFEGMHNAEDVLAKVEQDLGPEAARALANAFGMAPEGEAEELPEPKAITGPGSDSLQ